MAEKVWQEGDYVWSAKKKNMLIWAKDQKILIIKLFILSKFTEVG